jgi:uncharacterized linocin/CFP29 family protein
MNDLLRDLAPITDAGWKMIDDQARQTLVVELAGRKLVDFDGPKGWHESAMNLGRVKMLKGGPAEGTSGAIRQVQPLVELRAPFALSRAELDNIERGAADPDLDPLIDAAIHIARGEDRAIFHGWEAAGIGGICERTPYKPIKIQDNYAAYPSSVAEAVRTLKTSGVGGPYAIALGPRCFTGLMQAMGPGGFPILEVVKHIVDGDVVWAPGVDGAVVLSTRGGDFELVVGRDLAIGYSSHDAAQVNLYIVESLTFRVLEPKAAVWLRYTR